MVSVDEIESYIQKWMSDALSPIELVFTYTAVRMELERLLYCCMDRLTGEEE